MTTIRRLTAVLLWCWASPALVAPAAAQSADFNSDGKVDFADFFLFADQFGKPVDDANRSCDLDADGAIGFSDFFRFVDQFGQEVEPAGDRVLYVVARHSGKCMEVGDASTEEGARVYQRQITDGEHQQWSLVEAEEGYAYVINENSQLALTVQDQSPDGYADIVQTQPAGLSHQMWTTEQGDDGSVTFVARHSGMALAVAYAGLPEGYGYVQEERTEGEHQKFLLVAAWEPWEHDSALEYYQSQLTAGNNRLENHRQISRRYVLSGDIESGDEHYTEASALFDSLMVAAGNPDDRAWWWDELLDYLDDYTEQLIDLAEDSAAGGDGVQGEAACQRTVEVMEERLLRTTGTEDAGSTAANVSGDYYDIGDAYQELEQYEQAVDAFEAGSALNPDNLWFHIELGSTYGFDLNRWQEGVGHHKTAFAADPDWGDWAFNNTLYFYRQLGDEDIDLDGDIALFSEVIDADSNNDVAYSVRAYLYERNELFPEAISDRTSVVGLAEAELLAAAGTADEDEVREELADALLARGSTYESAADYARAEEDMLRAHDLVPSSMALWDLSGVRSAQGDPAGWSDYLEQFLAMEDDDFVEQQEHSVRHMLANSYYREQQLFSQAVDHAREIAARFPGEDNHDYRWWEPRTVRLGVRWPTAPSWFDQETVELLLPVQNACQEHLAYTVIPEPQASRIYTLSGNTYASLTYGAPVDTITVEIDMVLRPVSLAGDGFGAPDADDLGDNHIGAYSSGGFEFDPQDALLVDQAAEVVGDEQSALEKARLIQSWLYANFTYETVSSPSIEVYLETRKAECGGYSMVYTALCRAAGVPTRRLYTLLCNYPEEGDLGSHVVSEFYDEQAGWVLVDNTGDTFGWFAGEVIMWRGTEDARDYHYPDTELTTVEYEFEGQQYSMDALD